MATEKDREQQRTPHYRELKRIRDRNYRLNHPDKFPNVKPEGWKKKTANPDYHKDYYAKNRDKILEYYQKNKDKFRLQQRNYRIKRGIKVKPIDFINRRKLMRDFVYNYKKDKSCSKCGYKEYPQILQFHHYNGDKKFTIGDSKQTRKYSLMEIKTEIDKCVLLCPNCHFYLHSREGRIL